jgi:DDE superfamily endonuclease
MRRLPAAFVTRPEPMTLGNMRQFGVRSLDVSCWLCHHQAVLSADRWPDHIAVPTFGPRMVCTSCGIVVDGAVYNRRGNDRKDILDLRRTLSRPDPQQNDIVMIDNLPAHKAAGVREAVEARAAALRYLPKYSADLNPIEMSLSRLKAYLRKAGERTIPRLRRRLGWFARNITAGKPRIFTHAGYA